MYEFSNSYQNLTTGLEIRLEAKLMIFFGEESCPLCGGKLKYYDKVKRIIRTKRRETKWIYIRRYKCGKCGSIHREILEDIYPYRQYESEVIFGVLEGFITPDILGFEDYPCEMTMKRWLKELS